MGLRYHANAREKEVRKDTYLQGFHPFLLHVQSVVPVDLVECSVPVDLQGVFTREDTPPPYNFVNIVTERIYCSMSFRRVL